MLLQLFVRGNPFRGSAGGDEPWPAGHRASCCAAAGWRDWRCTAAPTCGRPLRPLLPEPLPAAYSPGQMPRAQAWLLARLGLADPSAARQAFTD